MSRLIQTVLVVFSLLFFTSVQAGFSLPVKACAIFADEATDETKKEGEEAGDKKPAEEEEPECD
ncbi:MAG: hypothetical protein OQK69_12530 [Gammaproteobacteria bacterium]|nr:hypothetical protein [Gammaproteobacteria bacterium]